MRKYNKEVLDWSDDPYTAGGPGFMTPSVTFSLLLLFLAMFFLL